MVRGDAVVAGSFDLEAGRMVVRLRLIDTSTSSFGKTLVRVIREVPRDAGQGGFTGAISSAAAELLPELAQKSFGMLLLRNGRNGAVIFVDGALTDEFRESTKGESLLRVRAGSHALKVTASGHQPFERTVDIDVGQRSEVEVDLVKNHSPTPLILGGIGAAAAIAGSALVLSGHGIVTGWNDACHGDHCAPGYTRARYLGDSQSLDRDRLSSGGLFVLAGVAVVGGLIWYLLDPGIDSDGAGR
jgi:hypothetical protein